jgi:succinate dehydrogenase / fumarate reductase flavoprotein subunit
VNADTAAATLPGLFAAGECAAGMHGSNRLGGNSLGDLLVFGRRAGEYAAEYAAAVPKRRRPQVARDEVEKIAAEALAPFERDAGNNPYTVHSRLQQIMQDLVGIIRTEEELTKALDELKGLREEAAKTGVEGHRQFNPGWHLAIDLRNMIRVSECIATAALARKESRGGHTRDDYPKTDPEFGVRNHVLRLHAGELQLHAEPLPEMPEELQSLFDSPPRSGTSSSSGSSGSGNSNGSGSSTDSAGQSAQPGPAGLAPRSPESSPSPAGA